jgi:anaerobic magnesium-protoporphyrin IX monomethyl ester cyclase
MKITLFEITCPDIRSFGARCVSSYLRKHGFESNIVFMPPILEKLRARSGDFYLYEPKIIDQLVELCSDSQLIGISFLTYYFDRGLQLTKAFKDKLGIPVIWGGIHPSVRPDEAVEIADFVCVGEGEEATLELCQKMDKGEDLTKIPNIWLKKNGEVYKNPVRPLVEDIDRIVNPDYELDYHYIHNPEAGNIIKLDVEYFKKISGVGPLSIGHTRYHYNTMASRGCPYNCSYCCNNYYRKMYGGNNYLRWRSTEHFISELEYITNKFPFIDAFNFFDDSFFAMPDEMMDEFCEIYTRKFHYPFTSQSTPRGVTEKKMKLLIDTGLRRMDIGIQSGSKNINKMYKRHYSKDDVLKAANIVNGYKNIMFPPDYHLILDNPWETNQDVIDTLDVVLELPKPLFLKPSSLVLYPGSEVYQKAKAEDWKPINPEGITPKPLFEWDKEGKHTTDLELTKIYRKAFGAINPTYLNFLIILAGSGYFPRLLVKLLKKSIFVKLFQRESLSSMFEILFKIHKITQTIYDKFILRPTYKLPE